MRSLALAALVTALAFGVYFASPVLQLTDSLYTLLMSEQLMLHGNVELDAYFPPQQSSRGYPEVEPGEELPRHVRRHGEHVYHFFPHGTAFLSVPIVALARAGGISTIDRRGRYDVRGEAAVHRLGAALVTALAAGVFFLSARLYLPAGTSAAVAFAAAFGTQLWSTASRGMTSHTFPVLLLALALFLLLRECAGRGRAPLVLLSTLLAWSFFARPAAAACVAPLALFVLLERRAGSVPLFATGLGWLLAFLAYSRYHFDAPLPPYLARAEHFGLASFRLGLAANLISPSRGLLVYVPAVLGIGWLLAAHWRRVPCRALAVACLASAVLLVVLASSFRNWWAGSSYGARFTTELVPVWVALAVLGLRGARDAGRAVPRLAVPLAVLAVLVLAGAIANGSGALSAAGMDWNNGPVPVRRDPMRVFDWRRPQFAAALFPAQEEARGQRRR